jgi:hypothetical protein
LYQNSAVSIAPINTPIAEISRAKEEYISIFEALQQFKISLTWIYKKIKIAEIKPATIDGKTLYPLKPLKPEFGISTSDQNKLSRLNIDK